MDESPDVPPSIWSIHRYSDILLFLPWDKSLCVLLCRILQWSIKSIYSKQQWHFFVYGKWSGIISSINACSARLWMPWSQLRTKLRDNAVRPVRASFYSCSQTSLSPGVTEGNLPLPFVCRVISQSGGQTLTPKPPINLPRREEEFPSSSVHPVEGCFVVTEIPPPTFCPH